MRDRLGHLWLNRLGHGRGRAVPFLLTLTARVVIFHSLYLQRGAPNTKALIWYGKPNRSWVYKNNENKTKQLNPLDLSLKVYDTKLINESTA